MISLYTIGMRDSKIFRANDIRGIYPSEINEAVVFEIVCVIKKLFKNCVVVGHDARLSSPELYKSVLKALKQNRRRQGYSGRSKKIKVFEAGMSTSPAIYFLTNKLKADGGIMVTASHNPPEYNGLKIIGKGALPISGKEILKIMANEQTS